MVKYPEVDVKLLYRDSNTFTIIGEVTAAMRKTGIPKFEIDKYVEEATSGDYNDLLLTTMKWINIH